MPLFTFLLVPNAFVSFAARLMLLVTRLGTILPRLVAADAKRGGRPVAQAASRSGKMQLDEALQVLNLSKTDVNASNMKKVNEVSRDQ